jgi:CheY-like chemotaxis protein
VPLAPAVPIGKREAAPQRADVSQLADMVVMCIDNEPKILDGMGTLLGGWGCQVLKAPDLKTALSTMSDAKVAPSGLLVDYHLDGGNNGIEAIAALRWRFGQDLPAILITADRSPAVREDARQRDIQVLNKPLKPAALRALLAQWRIQRMAAAE